MRSEERGMESENERVPLSRLPIEFQASLRDRIRVQDRQGNGRVDLESDSQGTPASGQVHVKSVITAYEFTSGPLHQQQHPQR